MNNITKPVFITLASPLLLSLGCATAPPPELGDARQAYQRVSTGSAAQVAPAAVHQAKTSLDRAEKSFDDDSDSAQTRSLAYVAHRKALLAETVARSKSAKQETKNAQDKYQQEQSQIAQADKKELRQTRVQLADSQRQVAASERKAKAANDALAKLGEVKEEQRGLVITLSGSVLFASNRAVLLPAAQSRLNQVAEALMTTQERHLTIEGHTDSQGSAGHNLELSQQRAEAVRSHLISRGYPAERIEALGVGKDRPIADNASAEGRANNRRVEIIVSAAVQASTDVTGSNMQHSHGH